MTRYLPAAVLAEDDPRAANAARVVPAGAKLKKSGGAVLGYNKSRRAGGSAPIAAIRIRELERIIDRRHGGPCDTADAPAYAILAASLLIPRLLQAAMASAEANRRSVAEMVRERFGAWCDLHVPCLDAAEAHRIVGRAIQEQRRFSADGAARLIRLTMSERAALGVTTIGSIDFDAHARKALRREKDCSRKRAKRAAAPKRVKLCDARPWESEGVSRATWFRRQAAAVHETKSVRSNLNRNNAADEKSLTRPVRAAAQKRRSPAADQYALRIAPNARAVLARLVPIANSARAMSARLRPIGVAARATMGGPDGP